MKFTTETAEGKEVPKLAVTKEALDSAINQIKASREALILTGSERETLDSIHRQLDILRGNFIVQFVIH